jgi:hypothetical protein
MWYHFRGGSTRMAKKTKATKSTTKYKDSLFRVLYKDEQRAKELCEATSGLKFPEDAPIQLCTLEDSILNRYNDMGVAIGNKLLVLHEQQSSINPNMPYRLLEYLLYSYGKWFVDRKMLYGEELVEIPFPEFYVLYNGKKELKETTLKLSSAYKMKDRKVMLELEVDVIDINYERNHTVLEKSPTLKGYSYLIATIRKFIDAGDSRDVAVAKAVRKCISEGILADFLSENNFEEVCDMLDFEYNLEDELAVRGEQREKKGKIEGRIEGMVSVYFTEMSLNSQQIAEKLGIKEKEVSETLDRLQLV